MGSSQLNVKEVWVLVWHAAVNDILRSVCELTLKLFLTEERNIWMLNLHSSGTSSSNLWSSGVLNAINLSAKVKGKDYSNILKNPNSANNKSKKIRYQNIFRSRNQWCKRSIADTYNTKRTYTHCSFYQASITPWSSRSKSSASQRWALTRSEASAGVTLVEKPI